MWRMKMTRRRAAEALLAAAAAGVCPALGLAAVPQPPTPPPTPLVPPQAAPLGDSPLDGERDAFDHMTVPVMLNGEGPFPFMVDTGANISCVARRVAESLALPIQAARQVHTVVGVRSQPMAVIAELRVGAQTRRNMSALALAIEDPRLGGVLAVDWLQNQRLTLDFTRNSLEFAPSRHEYTRPGRVIVPARRRHGQLTIVEALLGERPINALIDSGSEASLCNAALRRLLDQTGATQPPSQLVQMVSILGEAFAGEMIFLPFLRLGGLQLGNVPVVQSDSHVFAVWGVANTPSVLLGMDLLRQFRAVSLDFGRSQVRFDLVET
jgi:predicted aspartyl protease